MLGTLNEDQIDHLLRHEVVGRIGCHLDGRTYVVPVTYAYDGGAVYGHSGEGLKIQMMRANPRVCFEVDHRENLANWQSVVAQGTFEELTGAAAAFAMQLLATRMAPLITSETMTPSHGLGEHPGGEPGGRRPPHVFRILLHESTGRFEKR
jgi:uncharacterized protein